MVRPQDQPAAELQVRPVRRVSTHSEVLTRIGAEIREGRLAAGDRLPPERQLAEMLNVSRTSLREGLAVLEAAGLLRSRAGSGPKAGTFMLAEPASVMNEIISLQVALNHFDLSEVVEFRRAIESAAVVKAARAADGLDFGAFDHILAAQVAAERREDFAKYDLDFHFELIRLGGNRLSYYMVQMCRDILEDRMVSGFKTIHSWHESREQFVEQHRGILQAVRDGDIELASERLLRHVTGPSFEEVLT